MAKQWLIREAPYKSEDQAAYMHIHHPEIAKQWDAEAEKKDEPAVQKEDEEASSKKSSWIFRGWRIK